MAHVVHSIGDLERDMKGIVRQVPGDLTRTVVRAARVGNSEARAYAKESAGAHGKHYHKAFTAEGRVRGVFGGYVAEYGPEAGRPQGDMSFENGSRNQPPHNDLAKSADFIGPVLARNVRRLEDGWFWK